MNEFLGLGTIGGAPPSLIFAFLAFVIWLVNRGTLDQTAMGQNRLPWIHHEYTTRRR